MNTKVNSLGEWDLNTRYNNNFVVIILYIE
ncbi:hypothetical protein EYZ11_013177 [Aspergillus tanneri]|uniref:Uncharacterized protein n=1 Tax=Aspergillus tanneri TaxID=1220188 RepID=A0A4S3J0I3_9EURO|nr:hypothetical protein EYZ11_013177 [Aspergillus tanneri]